MPCPFNAAFNAAKPDHELPVTNYLSRTTCHELPGHELPGHELPVTNYLVTITGSNLKWLHRLSRMADAFALQASDAFGWEDEVINEVLSDWSAPEVNFELNNETLNMHRDWFLGRQGASASRLGWPADRRLPFPYLQPRDCHHRGSSFRSLHRLRKNARWNKKDVPQRLKVRGWHGSTLKSSFFAACKAQRILNRLRPD